MAYTCDECGNMQLALNWPKYHAKLTTVKTVRDEVGRFGWNVADDGYLQCPDCLIINV